MKKQFLIAAIICFVLFAFSGVGWATTIDYYVDGSKADDTANGLSWANAKKTIYGCIEQVVTDLDGVVGNQATINVSGGASGRIYQETHNLIFSKGAHYPAVGGGALTLHDGSLGKPWTLQGSTEGGHNGQVSIDASTITTWQTYGAVIVTNINYFHLRRIQINPGSGDQTKDDVYYSVAEYGLIEHCRLPEYGAHGISMNASEESVIRYNYVKGRNHNDNSSGIKIAHTTTDNTEVYYNVIDSSGSTGANYHAGINIYNASGVKVYNNTIYNTSDIGILLWGTAGVGADDVVLYNNVISEDTEYSIVIDENCGSLTSDYNLIYKTGNVGYVGGTFTAVGGPVDGATKTFVEWQAAGYDANSTNASPLFVSATDFTLQSASPAIDAWPDIGAYEYQRSGGGLFNLNFSMGI